MTSYQRRDKDDLNAEIQTQDKENHAAAILIRYVFLTTARIMTIIALHAPPVKHLAMELALSSRMNSKGRCTLQLLNSIVPILSCLVHNSTFSLSPRGKDMNRAAGSKDTKP